jgi:hypothetical protein
VNKDRETLRLVGEALYGPLWQSPLARNLGVADRTVRRWVAGDFAIPDGIWPEIAAICQKRGAALAKWAERLG